MLQILAHEFNDWPAIRPGDFQGLVVWRFQGDIGQRRGDIERGNRLQCGRGQVDGVAVFATRVGNGTDELEELRGAQDRVRNARVFDEFFLSHFRPEVTTFEHALGADHRQCNMVFDAVDFLRREQVFPGRFEKMQRRVILE
ncbi:hypothetical protein D3C84_800250 [compost metagenome]